MNFFEVEEIKNNDKIKKYCNSDYRRKTLFNPHDFIEQMPLHEMSNSAVLRNKENARQVDPEQSLNASPIKQSHPNQSKCSPQKKNVLTQINQLKIKLSDRDFELKKLQEDCSVKLALMQKELTREKNEKKQILKESKQKLEEDRHYFETKIVLIEQEWKAKVQNAKNLAINESKEISDKQKHVLREKYEGQIKQLKSQILSKSEHFSKEKQQLTLAHQKQLASLQAKQKSQLQQALTKNEAEMMHIKQIHLSELQFYHQLEDQKSKEQHVVSKILSEKIRGLQEEIRSLRGQITQLKHEIELKNEEILNEKRQKENYRLDKICLERKLSRLEPDLKENCDQQILKAKSEYESLLAEQVAEFTKNLTSLSALYEQSITSYQSQIIQLQERCKQVALLHSSMKSNEEDIKKIEMLELKLIKREMELQKQREDTKMCKLELGNMDQMFQKMFEEAKVKSLKTRKHKLPSLVSVGQHRTTMDCYSNTNIPPQVKENKKFSIRDVSYNSISKAKESEFSVYE